MVNYERKKKPWEKSLAEMSKYDWIVAISHNQKHGRRPRDLRVAMALMQMADPDTCLAWPTQESLAEMSGFAEERQVRCALRSLVGTGAIQKVRISEISEESRAKLGIKRKLSGVAYRLKLFWAQEIFELSMSPAGARSEPAQLALSDKRGKRTNLDRQKRANLDRLQADQLSPPNTTGEVQDTENSTEGRILGVYTRDGVSAYAIASGRAG